MIDWFFSSGKKYQKSLMGNAAHDCPSRKQEVFTHDKRLASSSGRGHRKSKPFFGGHPANINYFCFIYFVLCQQTHASVSSPNGIPSRSDKVFLFLFRPGKRKGKAERPHRGRLLGGERLHTELSYITKRDCLSQ